jgi:hypothetical protein
MITTVTMMTITAIKTKRIRIAAINYNAIGRIPGCRTESLKRWAPKIQRPVTFYCRYSDWLRLNKGHQALQENFDGRLSKETLSITTTVCENLN